MRGPRLSLEACFLQAKRRCWIGGAAADDEDMVHFRSLLYGSLDLRGTASEMGSTGEPNAIK